MPVEMPTVDFADQSGIFDPSLFVDGIHVIGCGGIGASALPTLATLGITPITLWDNDIVEPRNVASQLMFRPVDVQQMRPKVDVAEEILRAYGVEEVIANQKWFTADEHGDELEGVVISAVDTMTVRQDIWRAVKGNPMVTCLIDGRIGGERYTLIVIDPCNEDHVAWYEKFQLFDEQQVVDLPCTERAVVYPAVALGAHMATVFANLQREVPIPRMRSEDMRTGEVSFIGKK